MSSDGFISNRRLNRLMQERGWVLNAILRARIKNIGPRHRFFWALCGDFENTKEATERLRWAQEFYIVDGFRIQYSDFTENGSPQLRSVPHSEYYFGYLPPMDDDLVLPDSISESIDLYDGLTKEERRRFIQAAQWMDAAYRVWDDHISSSYIAMVAAIETLIGPNQGTKPCPTCGLDTSPGPTQRFQVFVEQYVPSVGANGENKKSLYRLRSDLAHGRYLLRLDKAPPSFSAVDYDHREALDELFRIVQQAMINWLWHATTASRPRA